MKTCRRQNRKWNIVHSVAHLLRMQGHVLLFAHLTPNYSIKHYNMIAVFFPGFNRFIPGFDRFIPGFDRFIPASIPVTGNLPPPPPPPTIKNISSKKMYFLNLISSFFISLIWNNTIKKYSAMSRMHIFLKNTVNTNASYSGLCGQNIWPSLLKFITPLLHNTQNYGYHFNTRIQSLFTYRMSFRSNLTQGVIVRGGKSEPI